MNQQEAIGYIQDILPQISRSEEAEDVLLKFAHSKNLSPAQVERLGQVFNNAKTLTFLEKSANRGGSFPIISTENLVARYTDLPETVQDQVPGRSDAVIEWCGDDIKSASGDSNELSSFPSLEELEPGEPAYTTQPDELSRKEAAELDAHVRHLHDKAAADQLRVDTEFLDMFEEEQKDVIREKVAGIVDEIRMGELDWDASVKAAAYLLGSEDYEKVQGVVKSASNGKLNPPELDHDRLVEEYGFQPQARNSDEIRGLHSKLASVLEAFELLRVAREERDTVLGIKAAAETETQTDKKQDEEEEVDTTGIPHSAGPAEPANNTGPATTQHTNRKPPSSRQQSSNSGSGKKDKDDGGKSKKDKDDEGKGFESVLDGLFKGVEKSTEGMGPGSVNSGVKKLIEEGRSPNKAQRAVDSGLSDAAAQVSLTRALRDPIISEADPETVVSLFNSMRASNPGFVEDPNNLIMALREAVQYDSIPIHTLKELLDMNLSQHKIEELEHKNRGALYGNQPSRKG